MKINELVEQVAGENFGLRTKIVGRLLRVGITVDAELTTKNKPIVESLIEKCANTEPVDVAVKIASALPNHAHITMIPDKCPVCHGEMVEAMLHTSNKAKYCQKCHVAKT